MAFVGLKVDDGTKTLWVEAAGREGMSLSAWLKHAASQQLHTESTAFTAHTPQEQGQLLNPNPPADGAPHVEAEAADKIAEARALLGEHKEFKPDFKPAKKEKKR